MCIHSRSPSTPLRTIWYEPQAHGQSFVCEAYAAALEGEATTLEQNTRP